MFGFNISVMGENSEFSEKSFELISDERLEQKRILKYRHAERGIEVVSELNYISDNTVQCINRVINLSDKDIVITHFSSGVINGIADNGLWQEPERLKIYTCKNTWQGEFQWSAKTLDDLRIYRFSTHANHADSRIGSSGSWSTSVHFPMAIVEDTAENRSYYTEIQSSAGWEIKIGNFAEEELNDGYIYMECDAANELRDGWYYTLKKGESFEAAPAFCGACDGGLEEAAAELNLCRRTLNLAPFKDGSAPVIYNCYMNSLWTNINTDNLIPLIDAAAEAGAEYFCIDAGWYQGWGLGSWIIKEELFAPTGLKGIFAYMKSKGLKPGIWFEFEACCEGEVLYQKEHMLTRHGEIIGGSRGFLNFGDAYVREYLFKAIGSLCEIGLEMIKNDYNQTTGIGIDREGLCYSEALRKNTADFLDFIDEVRIRYPQLLIENCGSGGMRCDFSTLKHFELQSLTDQEIYYNMPAIASGALACIPPEKCGIWSTPYPRRYNDRLSELNDTEKQKMRAAAADGEETVFNMVTSLLGNMYLSGRIEVADELNFNLIYDAVFLYKRLRSSIEKSNPVWPQGTFTLGDKGIFSTALENDKENMLMMAVWRIDGSCDSCDIPLKGKYKNAKIAEIYPNRLETKASLRNGILHIELPKNKTARFFVIR